MDGPPEIKSLGDAGYRIAKATLGIVPVFGGPLQDLFENVFTEPIEKRKHEWLKQLGQTILDLQTKIEGFAPDKLKNNSAFISLALHATNVSLRTHQEEKLNALRNAVINSVLITTIEENLQMMFLRFIDVLTPLHMRMLAIFNDPTDWMKKQNIKDPQWQTGGVVSLIDLCMPELDRKREMSSQIFLDLQAMGLLLRGSVLGVTMTGSGILQPRTTDIGKQFLIFISDTSLEKAVNSLL